MKIEERRKEREKNGGRVENGINEGKSKRRKRVHKTK